MTRTKGSPILLGLLLISTLLPIHGAAAGQPARAPRAEPALQTTTVLLDDFAPQPLQGESVWFYNRMGGDRGQIDGWWDPACACSHPGGGTLLWGQGFVTATITQNLGTEAWVGVWASPNHPVGEGIPLDFSAIFPAPILPEHQGRVVGLRIEILDGVGTFQVELQAPDLSIVWSQGVALTGGPRSLQFVLPLLGEIRNVNWLVKGQAGHFVTVDRVALDVQVPPLDLPERAFAWNYAMLLANWDPASGLIRDRARFPAGDFDNISASGMQAAAAALASHLGLISHASAVEIVDGTTSALLALPRCHGLWPHFTTGGQITPDTEWSSLDTVIAAVALLEARQALGLDTGAAEQVLTTIDWEALLTPEDRLSHGYDYACSQQLENSWYDFGTETWLINFGYAAATGNLAEMDPTPPTFNGSGFIDELAWLLMPAPCQDPWQIGWPAYRRQAVAAQLAYYESHPCYGPLGLFGLSAAEVPDPSLVPPASIYQAFGVGGTVPPNDGTDLLGHAVVTPHYAGMVTSLVPAQAAGAWSWLEGQEMFTPLNNVESLMFVDEPTCETVVWNDLKGSWNLSLQTLGWGRRLAGAGYPLYSALEENALLRQGYEVMGRFDCRTLLPLIQNERAAGGPDLP